MISQFRLSKMYSREVVPSRVRTTIIVPIMSNEETLSRFVRIEPFSFCLYQK